MSSLSKTTKVTTYPKQGKDQVRTFSKGTVFTVSNKISKNSWVININGNTYLAPVSALQESTTMREKLTEQKLKTIIKEEVIRKIINESFDPLPAIMATVNQSEMHLRKALKEAVRGIRFDQKTDSYYLSEAEVYSTIADAFMEIMVPEPLREDWKGFNPVAIGKVVEGILI